MPLILDAHQDLAFNMTVLGRDYCLPNAEIRLRDRQNGNDVYGGGSLLGLPEYNAGNVGLVFGTLFSAPERRVKQRTKSDECYSTPTEAHRIYWNQLDFYHKLAETQSDAFRLVLTKQELKNHLDLWENQPDTQNLLASSLLWKALKVSLTSTNCPPGGNADCVSSDCSGWQPFLRRNP